MHDILLQIIEKRKKDLYQKKRVPNKFKTVFLNLTGSKMVVIAEIKLASPTMPSLGTKNEVLQRAIAYENAGAEGISFITEKHYFKGDSAFIPKIKSKINLPILQKDFVIDPYQIYEAKIIGSDAILLIARLVSKNVLKSFVALSQEIGVEPIVEINDAED